MQEPGAVPGYFEEEAIKCASSALQLSSLPSDQCQAHLALGRAQTALYHLTVGGGQAAAKLAWPETSEADPKAEVAKGLDVTKVILVHCHRVHAGCLLHCWRGNTTEDAQKHCARQDLYSAQLHNDKQAWTLLAPGYNPA